MLEPEVQALIESIPALDISMFSYDEWREIRMHSLGGSEIAAIVNSSPYDSPLSVYCNKLGLAPQKEENEPMYWGKALEAVVADEFAKREGLPVVKVEYILYHPEHSFLSANIDRLIVHPEKGFGILECKTASAYKLAEWEHGNIPAHYYLQIQHYLGITGFDFAYCAALIGGNTYRCVYIERDDHTVEYLQQSGIHFWTNHIEKRIQPPAQAMDLETLSNLYPQHSEGLTLDMKFEDRQLVDELLASRRDEKEAKAMVAQAKSKVQDLMGEAETLSIEGVKMFTWKTNKKGSRTFRVLADEGEE